jgi:hypothetical protein
VAPDAVSEQGVWGFAATILVKLNLQSLRFLTPACSAQFADMLDNLDRLSSAWETSGHA